MANSQSKGRRPVFLKMDQQWYGACSFLLSDSPVEWWLYWFPFLTNGQTTIRSSHGESGPSSHARRYLQRMPSRSVRTHLREISRERDMVGRILDPPFPASLGHIVTARFCKWSESARTNCHPGICNAESIGIGEGQLLLTSALVL